MNDKDEPAAVQGTTRTARTHVDGTLVVQIEFDPTTAKAAFGIFGMPGIPVAIARLTPSVAKAQMQSKAMQSAWGKHYQILYRTGWFYHPDVAAAFGTDDEFLAWLRNQPCAFCQAISTDQAKTEAAHVRRVASGSGTGIKPPYSAIPLCHRDHALQHQKGESAMGGKEWFDQMRGKYITAWIKERLYAMTGTQSLGEVPPDQFREICLEHNIAQLLPRTFGEDKE